ncbi:hypothetical protein QQ045_032600 [Rhodiola kirilowii]
MKSEIEEKYQQYVNTLTDRIQTCDDILHQVDDTLALCNALQLQLQHQAVATKTKTIHDACDRLLLEEQWLVEFAEALRTKLNYFDELENVSSSFYAPNICWKWKFLPLLIRLDDCISYVECNPQYAESSVYLVKFRQLQVLGLLRSSSGSNTTVPEGVEAYVTYVRFKAAASELKQVLEEIESRASRKEYGQLLTECDKHYCEQRLSWVCQLEHQLFDHFFQSSSEDVSSLAPLIDTLCTLLYDTLRPKLIHETNLDFLCELVDILNVEVLGEQLSRRSEPLAGLRSTLHRILADVHERLTFRARTHIRDELQIVNYVPFDEDLDYPAKLEQLAEIKSGDTSLVADMAYNFVFPGSSGSLLIVDRKFSVTHKELDYSHLLELEKSLKATCEEFIMSVTKLVVDPMLSFVTKARRCSPSLPALIERIFSELLESCEKLGVTAVRVSLSLSSPGQQSEPVMRKPLKEQAFATPEWLSLCRRHPRTLKSPCDLK